MSARRKGLGRGLDALLGAEPDTTPSPGGGALEVAIDKLEPNRFQPRSAFDDASLDGLAESIRAQGVVQPIVVALAGPGRYTIVAGERRWRASKRAGLDRVPVVVRDVPDDRTLLELALVENLQRTDLNPIEEAEAYRLLHESFELSQESIAQRVGKGRTTVTNALRLLRLPDEVQQLLKSGRLTAGQARPLLALGGARRQCDLAKRAVREGLTARELERLAGDDAPPSKKTGGRRGEKDPDTRDAEERLTRALQTRVEIARRRRGGAIRIHFQNEQELIRLFDALLEG